MMMLHWVQLCALWLLPLSTLGTLTVHIVPHTHDDVGWLKTVDEYFSGSNDTIQHAGVRNILNSVVTSLQKNSKRKFTYVEQAFFQRWWRELNENTRNVTKTLVKNRQLNFANGGWCMHDEAATHYVDMVDQTTLGHRLLKEAFGDDGIVTIGWQLDPFGHSASQAALLSADAGFDGLFFGRIDYQDLAARHKSKRNEFVWRGSPSLGDDAQVFSSLTGEYGGNYGPPGGFNWNGNDEPIETNENLSTYNVPARVEAAVQAALSQANMTRGDNIMWTMGSDFNYEAAEIWFTNLDKLIASVNADGRINMKYSSPQEYVEAKRAEKTVTWPLTTGDFFPYADGPHKFWSGYFTSRPALKGMVRSASSFSGAVRAIQSLASVIQNSRGNDSLQPIEQLEEALGVLQHHDAVSGTAKQHVAFDYAKRLSAGVEAASLVMTKSVAAIKQATDAKSFGLCPRLNETVCKLSQGASVEVVVWNSLARVRTEVITVPVYSSNVNVYLNGEPVPVQVYAAEETVTNYQRNTQETKYVASFAAEVHPLGFSSFVLKSSADNSKYTVPPPEKTEVTLENEFLLVTFSKNGLISSITNKASGVNIQLSQSFCFYISNIGDKSSNQASGAYIYRPVDSTCHTVATSGDGASIELFVDGEVLQEVRQRFSPWLTQTVRLPAGARHLELQHTVGAIPIELPGANKTLEECVSWRQTGGCSANGPREPTKDLGCAESVPNDASGYCECFDGRIANPSGCGHVGFTCDQACKFTAGRELVSRFNSSIASEALLLTDSNGREMLQRRRNVRPTWNFSQTEPVAGNYYPINSAAAIRDSKSQLTVLVDRAVGAGSINDGTLELMIHRRILHDDGRGVGEPLNETSSCASYAGPFGGAHSGPGLVIRGTHRLSLEPPSTAARIWRPLADRVYSPTQLLFNVGKVGLISNASFSYALPPNVELMTLQALSATTTLLRLSHQFGIDEDEDLSQPVTVDILKLFASSPFKIISVTEVSLTNSQTKSKILQRRKANAAWKTDAGDAVPHPWRMTTENDDATIVTLGPLEIKTFVVEHA